MKYLYILFALILFSCTEIIEDNTEIYTSEWRWNMQDTHTRTCGGLGINPIDADIIVIRIQSDEGVYYEFYDYTINENNIILTASEQFQTDEFNDPGLIRMTIKLIKW